MDVGLAYMVNTVKLNALSHALLANRQQERVCFVTKVKTTVHISTALMNFHGFEPILLLIKRVLKENMDPTAAMTAQLTVKGEVITRQFVIDTLVPVLTKGVV